MQWVLENFSMIRTTRESVSSSKFLDNFAYFKNVDFININRLSTEGFHYWETWAQLWVTNRIPKPYMWQDTNEVFLMKTLWACLVCSQFMYKMCWICLNVINRLIVFQGEKKVQSTSSFSITFITKSLVPLRTGPTPSLTLLLIRYAKNWFSLFFTSLVSISFSWVLALLTPFLHE